MKNSLIIAVISLMIASCSSNISTNSTSTDSSTVTNKVDTIKPVLNDTVPDGNSSSSSEFNKGGTSPAGSTGGVNDSSNAKSADSMAVKKVKDKKAKKDSVKK
jgi:outer membrane murein-binding lipoprotein Lpp